MNTTYLHFFYKFKFQTLSFLHKGIFLIRMAWRLPSNSVWRKDSTIAIVSLSVTNLDQIAQIFESLCSLASALISVFQHNAERIF